MKSTNIILLFVFIIFTFSCNTNKNEESTETVAEISFEYTQYDFGDIAYDSDGRCYFEFTNTSRKNDLIIHNVRSSCGCTRPEWPEEPVKPGEKGKIGISYNTKLAGNFNKNITVYSNTENSPLKLFIKGNVAPMNVEE
ncbi:MAG: DUF1573 domain-containing protein [Bacteroidales bacterium]|nr:DUF1573 domain-containing protein [Bacteroidales bacterium]MCF8389947.1 DUF1573 domain-containing protein [Bacteroidales bacterium]